VNVTQDIDEVRQAALELMVESLKEEDTERQLANLLAQGEAPEALAKMLPRRTLVDAYYLYAEYLMWLRATRDADVDVEILADEAEGLRAIEAARQEYEREHPACPECGNRQYSRFAVSCRISRCGAKFEKRS
jgi:hypothetical protein